MARRPPWRLSPALRQLREQVDDVAPQRGRAKDGTIGDDAHAARPSAHNADADGTVDAWDCTHDPPVWDAHALADRLLAAQDPRLRLIISRGRIGSGPAGPQPGVWRRYRGQNPHDGHVHIEVVDTAAAEDDRPWLGVEPVTAAAWPIPARTVLEDPVDYCYVGKDLIAYGPWGKRRVEDARSVKFEQTKGWLPRDLSALERAENSPDLQLYLATLPWTEPAR